MVGQGTTNGHAFNYKNEFIVFLPIEGYKTFEQLNVFVTHEILHALHYSAQPEFYFNTQKEKDSVFRQLVTEGLATYLTKEVLGISDRKALWADYISETEISKWSELCKSEKQNLFKEVHKLINEKSTNPSLFYSSDVNNIRKYRAGYFIGLDIIKEIAEKGVSKNDFFNITRTQFEQLLKEVLSKYDI